MQIDCCRKESGVGDAKEGGLARLADSELEQSSDIFDIFLIKLLLLIFM